MGKVKIKKHSTHIDMTAMSDVTVLLLTFFMLTSTFLQKEPVQVITPPSVSTEVVPSEKLVQVLVGPDGKVYMNLTGARDSSVLSSENFRLEVLHRAYNQYREKNPSAPKLTVAEETEFTKLNTFGVPMKDLAHWLDQPMEKRDEELKTGGIPIAMSIKDGQPNEFQIWLRAIKEVMQERGLGKDLTNGRGVAIKAGQYSPYHLVQVVMDNLQTEKLNKFTLMTSLKSEEE
ncbi:MAG: biopolymer transporter ExbD [Muribaculaceae bacterium]|nr:biopolymer transporter ExbD [Muribaculaceae bacterium]